MAFGFFRKSIGKLFGSEEKKVRKARSENFFEDLEDALIEGDLGAALAMKISDSFRARCTKERGASDEELLDLLKAMLLEEIKTDRIDIPEDEVTVLLFLGVNGVGKTTNLAKLASYYRRNNVECVMAAGDTFRAAAIEQLSLHASRLGIRCVAHQHGGDPAAVLYDAIESAKTRKIPLVLADTAGRMHTRDHLLKELSKIDKVVAGRGVRYKKILVIDATTGQNSLQQAELFHETVGLDGIILSKYDSMAKGGAIVQICSKLKLPVLYVGVGEGYEDIRPFDPQEFADNLVGAGVDVAAEDA